MIRMAVVAALIFGLPTAAKTVHRAQMSRDVLDALRPETIEGKDVAPIVAELRKFIPEIPRACDRSTNLLVVYRGPDAVVTMLDGDKECFAVRGPANGVRFIIFTIRGEPV